MTFALQEAGPPLARRLVFSLWQTIIFRIFARCSLRISRQIVKKNSALPLLVILLMSLEQFSCVLHAIKVLFILGILSLAQGSISFYK